HRLARDGSGAFPRMVGADPASRPPPNLAARRDVPNGPCKETFRRAAAARRYHQSGCTGAFSVCTPVRANCPHSGGLILPSFCQRSLSLSIKSVGGTSYAVVIVSARKIRAS